jgi:regulatory protein
MSKRVPSADDLRSITEAYLTRYATSAAHLRRLLRARFRRAEDYDPARAEEYHQRIDAEIARLVGLRLLDDGRYAESKARILRRRGASGAKIRAALQAKGLGRDLIERALDPADAEPGVDPELEAARTWARKHRIGRWRREEADPEGRRKELARLVRNGFPYELARKVVDERDER